MWYYYWIFRISADSNTILNDFNLSMRQIETVVRNLFHFPVQSLIWFSTSQKVALNPSIQPDQNMVIPERQSGTHMNSSFEVSSYFGQAVVVPRFSPYRLDHSSRNTRNCDISFIWVIWYGTMTLANRVNRILLDLWFCSDFCILVLWLICNVPVMKPISVYDLINLHSERFLKRWTKASTTHQKLSNWKCH